MKTADDIVIELLGRLQYQNVIQQAEIEKLKDENITLMKALELKSTSPASKAN